MKASQLIEKLQAIIDQEGDLDVYSMDGRVEGVTVGNRYDQWKRETTTDRLIFLDYFPSEGDG